MRISRISVWQMELPLHTPYFLSGGRLRFDSLDSTIIRIDTDEGLSGWGEACPWGHTYLPAHGPGVRAGLGVLAPSVIGLDPRQRSFWPNPTKLWTHASVKTIISKRRDIINKEYPSSTKPLVEMS